MEVALVAANTQLIDGTWDPADPGTGGVIVFDGVTQSGLGREPGTEGPIEHLEPKARYFGDL